ncbi:MAG: FtsX-like permease family protein, partial [Bacteroidota bacterium]
QSYYLQPVSNIYLNPELVGDYLTHGITELNWIFGLIALIILILACVNFVNLSVANSLTRSKEVGLMKVVGSSRSNLIARYLAESCLYSLISMMIGLFIATAILPFFNMLADTSLTLPWTNLWFLILLMVSAVVIGILSGLYPALILSGFAPIEAIKGKMKGQRSSFLQQGLVVMQFTATVVLIISALVLQRQFDYVMNKPLGYDREQVVNILGLNTLSKNEREAFKNELKRLSVVQNATLGDFIPVEGSQVRNRSYWNEGRKYLDSGIEAARWIVDTDYMSTMKMELLSGRNFREGTSDTMSIIINEKMSEALGLKDPVGKRVIDMFDEKYHVIGLVKNFDFESAFGEVRPLAMVLGQGRAVVSARINSPDVGEAMKSITATWDEFSPNQSARFQFMDVSFEHMYEDFTRAKTIFIIFSVLSIVIACSGMFALSLYLIARRTKEISIRKVLGASVPRILKILTFGFVKLVIISLILAIPIAYQFSDYILQDFTYRIEVTWDVFLLGGITATVIALGTISFESVKAALTDPAKQLKDE